MNSVIETIHKRRSTRFYTGQDVEKDTILEIIKAGNMAPTGTHQNWRFVAVTSKELLEKLKDYSIPMYNQFMENMPQAFKDVRAQIDSMVQDPIYYSAPAAVFILGKGSARDADCNMVCQNMMIAGESLGLNSCYVYFGQMVLNHPEIKELFKIDEDEKVYGPIIFGKGVDGVPNNTSKKDPVITWL